MRMLTFDLVKSFLREGHFEGRADCVVLTGIIEKHVDHDEIIEFYPKGLFVNQRVEFFVFKKDGLLVLSTNGIHSVAKSFKYKDLLAAEYIQSESDVRKRGIELKFSNESFQLQSDADTNDVWSDRLGEAISRIFKLIS